MMTSTSRRLSQGGLCLATVALVFQVNRALHSNSRARLVDTPLAAAEDGKASLVKRASDFPATWIKCVDVDLTSPGHWVTLEWAGPMAELQDEGPFHASPGAGNGSCDCNDVQQSRINGSNCTPKGSRVVEGFNDVLPKYPSCTYVTWFDSDREIAIHYSRERPVLPASQGCVRVSEELAQIIHNNAIAGSTEVRVHGEWTDPRSGEPDPTAN